MFDFRVFLMTGFKNAVGNMPDYKVILNASGWFDKSVLTEDDLAELQALIEEKNNRPSEVIPDEVTEGEPISDETALDKTASITEENSATEDVVQEDTVEVIEEADEV